MLIAVSGIYWAFKLRVLVLIQISEKKLMISYFRITLNSDSAIAVCVTYKFPKILSLFTSKLLIDRHRVDDTVVGIDGDLLALWPILGNIPAVYILQLINITFGEEKAIKYFK